MSYVRTLCLLVFAWVAAVAQPVLAQEEKSEKASPRTAYGDTPQFWETYALVVAKVVDVKHGDEEPNLVFSDVHCSVQECVPDRYPPGRQFSLRFEIDLRFRPVRDKPGYAIDLQAGERLMLMMVEEKGKLIHAAPRIPNIPNYFDPAAVIDLKAGSDPIPLQFEFRGISSFGMLPDSWKLRYPKQDDAMVAETVRVCRALSEKDTMRRLEQIQTIQKDKPGERVQDLLRRRLQTTLETSLQEAQEAARLLKASPK